MFQHSVKQNRNHYQWAVTEQFFKYVRHDLQTVTICGNAAIISCLATENSIPHTRYLNLSIPWISLTSFHKSSYHKDKCSTET